MKSAIAEKTAGAPPMRRIAGGRFFMGSEAFYADEGPVHEVEVGSFCIDVHLVTNEQFTRFVDDTGYLTTAERELSPTEFPTLTAAERAPGSLVFAPTDGPVPLNDWRQWWDWRLGADWRHPLGASSSIRSAMNHPVIQVSFDDATRYAQWAGKRLATEQEWEFAALGGAQATRYAWGDEPRPAGVLMANTWQGVFPYSNRGANGWVGTSPVGSFPANGYGLHDMIGNVWEWTSTPYTSRHEVEACCVGDIADVVPGVRDGRRVLKGGSHLCAPEYCLRYRPAARSPQSDDTSTTHIGFRCVAD